jgi:enamine deaminase RidA (YjgF/YER057c/UK114 family)
MADVVKCTVLLVDMADFAEVNKMRNTGYIIIMVM